MKAKTVKKSKSYRYVNIVECAYTLYGISRVLAGMMIEKTGASSSSFFPEKIPLCRGLLLFSDGCVCCCYPLNGNREMYMYIRGGGTVREHVYIYIYTTRGGLLYGRQEGSWK